MNNQENQKDEAFKERSANNGINVKKIIASIVIIGIILFVAILLLRAFIPATWWVVAADPVFIHSGIFIVVLLVIVFAFIGFFMSAFRKTDD